jgi:hypothetical protein
MRGNTYGLLILHKANLRSVYLSEHLPLASSESRDDGPALPAYASESGSGYGENHTIISSACWGAVHFFAQLSSSELKMNSLMIQSLV